jgi:hypothetical protein
MQRLLTEVEKVEIIECEWAEDETDESGKPRVSVVIALRTWVTRGRGDE